MTPLAAHLVRQLIARPKHRVGIWRDETTLPRLREDLDDIHCFELTACLPLVVELKPLMESEKIGSLMEDFTFLPAPKTWIEWKMHGQRFAVLLQPDRKLNQWANVIAFWSDGGMYIGNVHLNGEEFSVEDQVLPTTPLGPDVKPFLVIAHIWLLIINSPHVIGRRSHNPNFTLERRLTRAMGVGKFPLHAWTEVLLEVGKPIEIDDGEPHESHLTGRRALHFVRKHLRIRYGRLEYVSAHWRGDAALGIKQQRYVVRPSRERVTQQRHSAAGDPTKSVIYIGNRK